jgi:RHS repeat-associated protein
VTAVSQAGDTTTYSYDGDGRRLTAQTPDRTVGFQWEPLSYQLAAETTTNGTGDRRYHLAGGGPVAINDTAGRQFLHRDALGSVRATTDTTGTVTGRYDYEPYGQLRGPPTQTAPALAFTGQYQDPTGLYHLRHRTYDPAVGQFLSPDPAAGPISAAYRYAAANPMVYVDPLGLWEAPGWVTTVNQIAGGVEVVAGTAAVACVYLCQPAVPVLGAVAATAGVVTAATSAALAVDACTTPKGACGGAIITAAIDTAGAVTVGGEMLRLRQAAPQAILKTPQVSSPRLQNIINDLYKGTTNPGRVGTGTTADAVRFELANPGAQVFGRSHIQKAEDYLRGLENWLKANPNAPYSERLIARSMADDLLDALGRSQ